MTTTITTSTVSPVYTVHGMSCGHCVAAITRALAEIEGVRRVEVCLERAEVRVEADSTPIDAAVRAAITDAGYEVE